MSASGWVWFYNEMSVSGWGWFYLL